MQYVMNDQNFNKVLALVLVLVVILVSIVYSILRLPVPELLVFILSNISGFIIHALGVTNSNTNTNGGTNGTTTTNQTGGPKA